MAESLATMRRQLDHEHAGALRACRLQLVRNDRALAEDVDDSTEDILLWVGE